MKKEHHKSKWSLMKVVGLTWRVKWLNCSQRASTNSIEFKKEIEKNTKHVDNMDWKNRLKINRIKYEESLIQVSIVYLSPTINAWLIRTLMNVESKLKNVPILKKIHSVMQIIDFEIQQIFNKTMSSPLMVMVRFVKTINKNTWTKIESKTFISR